MNASLLVKNILDNSHDLRSPVATAQSFFNILEMKDYSIDKEELKELCIHIHDLIKVHQTKIDELILMASQVKL